MSPEEYPACETTVVGDGHVIGERLPELLKGALLDKCGDQEREKRVTSYNTWGSVSG